MTEFVNLISQNQVLSLFVFWILLAILNKQGRRNFVDSSYKLITSPSELDKYPEGFVEKTEKDFKAALVNPIQKWSWSLGRLIVQMWEKYNWKLVGQFMLAIFLVAFFIADAIVIANAIDASPNLRLESFSPSTLEFLGQYGLAVGMGTFISFITAAFVFIELNGISEFTEYGKYQDPVRAWFDMGSRIVLVVSLVSGVSLGLIPLGLEMPLWPWIPDFVNIALNIFVRLSVLLASGLIITEGLKGLRIIVLVILSIIFVILLFIYYVANILGSLGRIILDFVIRFLRWILLVISFLLLPFDLIASVARRTTDRTSDNDNPSS